MEYELWDGQGEQLLLYTEDSEEIIQALDKAFEMYYDSGKLDGLVLSVAIKSANDDYEAARIYVGSEAIFEWLELAKSM